MTVLHHANLRLALKTLTPEQIRIGRAVAEEFGPEALSAFNDQLRIGKRRPIDPATIGTFVAVGSLIVEVVSAYGARRDRQEAIAIFDAMANKYLNSMEQYDRFLGVLTEQLQSFSNKSTEHYEKVALVIGNGAYVGPLKLNKPANDSASITQALESLGFDVTQGIDVTRKEMIERKNRFKKKVASQVSLLFYAGHGVHVDDKNYLIPIDAKITDQDSLRNEALDLNDVIVDMVTSSETCLVFLDACRSNPFTKTTIEIDVEDLERRSARDFLFSASNGIFISYAASRDQFSLEGPASDKHSPFTSAILENIAEPNLTIDHLGGRVTESVRLRTHGHQVPRRISTLREPFVFVPELKPPPPPPPVDVDIEPEPAESGGKKISATAKFFQDLDKASGQEKFFAAVIFFVLLAATGGGALGLAIIAAIIGAFIKVDDDKG